MEKTKGKQVITDEDTRRRLTEAKAILDQHSLYDPLPLNRLARQVFFHPRTFTGRFFLLFGRTPTAYLFERRMLTAAQLLKDSNDSVFSVAVMVGYQHTSSFSCAFKKRFGVTPKEWRAGHTDRQQTGASILFT